MKNLNEMTSKELKEMAKELRVASWWTKNKAQLIEDISAIQNASEEEIVARNEELAKEDKLFEHYSKNWMKYGPRNDWSNFYKDFKAGKITLVDDLSSDEKEEPETDISASKESIEEIVGQDSLEEQEATEKEVKDQRAKKESKAAGRGKQIEYDGRSMNLNDWAKELGFTRQTLYARLYIQNWDVEKAFTTPGRKAK